ncbi:MAG: hypothetical protein PGN16_20075, partial [Sphingomonas phyllosphaerae]
EVLESYVTRTRDKKGLRLSFMRKAMKRHGTPEAIATNGLRSLVLRWTSLATTRSRKPAAGRTTASKIRTCPSDDESER